MLAELLELGHEWREVAVAGHDHERVDVVLRIGEVDGVDHEADVGGVLARHAAARNLDEFDRGLVQPAGVGTEAAPIGVRLLGDDLALLDEALEHLADFEAVAAIVEPEPHVLEVDEYGE